MAEISSRRMARHLTWKKSGPVVAQTADEDVAISEEISTARLAEPGSMALFGFATGTWMAGVVVGGVFPIARLGLVAPTLIAFAGLAQFIAGLYSFRKANTFAGTAFCSYGANNVVVGFFAMLQTTGLLPLHGAPVTLLGFELVSFGFISLALLLASLPLARAFSGILAPLAAGFVLASLPDLTGQQAGAMVSLGHIGGYLLMASAAVAYYAAAGLVVNSTWQRNVLPLGGEA
jgi:succinate-acetate transporter protein